MESGYSVIMLGRSAFLFLALANLSLSGVGAGAGEEQGESHQAVQTRNAGKSFLDGATLSEVCAVPECTPPPCASTR